MALRRSRSSARLRANRVPHVPRALSHSANLLMVPRMQALITRLSRRACRSACKNKDRGKELFLSNMVGSAGGRFSQQGRSSVAQDEDVLGREAKARKLFVVELSDPRPYALLAWVVVRPNKPAHQARSGFQRSGRARPCLGARKLDGHRQPPDFVAEGPTSARGLAHQPDASWT